LNAIARALIYAGLPDPVWPVPEDLVARLLALWEALEPVARPPQSPPALGYRGIELRLETGETFSAASGLVHRWDGGVDQTRRDDRREFEGLVIRSAPPGALPAAVTG